MFTFSNVLHFFAHEFACLGRRRLALAGVVARPLNYFFFWHIIFFSRRSSRLDVVTLLI